MLGSLIFFTSPHTQTTKAYDALLKLYGLQYLRSVLGPAVNAIECVCDMETVDLARAVPGEHKKRSTERLEKYCDMVVRNLFETVGEVCRVCFV